MPRGGGSKSGGGTVRVSGYTRADGTYVAGYTRSSPGSGARSGGSLGGSSRSSGASNTVHVSGYMRSDGTYVSGYTRSSPGTSSSRSHSSSSASSDKVKVSGYTRADGTYVAGYTRSARGSGTASGESYSNSSTSSDQIIQVSGYTRADGTYVSGYTRSAPGSGNTSGKSHTDSYVSSIDKVHVSGYMRADGTPVAGYERSPPTVPTNTITMRCYADNALNRKLGRVGKPLGSHVVGKLDVPKKKEKTQQYENCLEKYSLEDLIIALGNLSYSDPSRTSYQYAVDQLQRETVEEDWKKRNLDPSTSNVTHLGHVVSQMQQEVVKDHTEKTSLSTNVSGVGYHTTIPFRALKLDKVIGSGGFGEVYAARLDASGHEMPVAFKKLWRQRISKRQSYDFLNEVSILASISHPHVIKMFGAVAEENNIGIVMEYLKCSLYRVIFIECVQLSEPQKRTIIYQVADALNYLHTCEQRKIAHCDIKTENILLDWQDNAKLCDFGLSAVKKDTESTRSNTAGVAPGQGTPRYSAPEVLRGEILSINQLLQADIYSLAVVVFEVISEEEPFCGLNVRQLQVHVGDGTLLPTTHASNVVLPQPVEDLLDMCWERDAIRRPTAAEFHAKWNSLVIMNP